VWEELRNTRNIRPAFAKLGFWGGLAYSALDAYVLRGKAPWTMGHHQDHETLRPASQSKRIEYPRRTASSPSTAVLRVPGEHQPRGGPAGPPPARDPARWKAVNWEQYRSPESRYCPAAVYEAVGPKRRRSCAARRTRRRRARAPSVEAGSDGARLVINAQNCVHCKTCDIKDPTQNINWATPEGGGGPNYIGGM
jgi:electron-transferring-flavoprotein dehydrogenase